MQYDPERLSSYVDRLLRRLRRHKLDKVKLKQQLAAEVEKNKRLHRRCQLAESAVKNNIAECRKQGVSLGRVLSAAGYAMIEDENKRRREALELIMQLTEFSNAKGAYNIVQQALKEKP